MVVDIYLWGLNRGLLPEEPSHGLFDDPGHLSAFGVAVGVQGGVR